MISRDTSPQKPISYVSPSAPEPLASRSRGADTRGAALVIVLGFVVLLVVVVLAFFSTATGQKQISDSSSNQVKVELLAQGAGDQILADLEQEIAAGSTNIGTSANPVYVPKNFTTMIQAMPVRSGTNGLGSLPANVLKLSAFDQRFYPTNTATYDTNGPLRASADSSTNATRSGRSVTLARWNAPLLLPKANWTNSSDLTPITNGINGFVAPDWIYVTATGSNPVITTSTSVTNYTVTNSDPVIGRYAYVIYHEGGLLDMNLAGYPPVSSTNTNHIIMTQGAKPVPHYVDLTAIPGIGANDAVTGAAALSAANQTNLSSLLVGWRNYASSMASNTMGNLASPGYTNFSASNFFTTMIAATNGFLTTARVPLMLDGQTNTTGQSDRIFTSRQQLIRFLSDAAGTDANKASLQNALQYMGTFSRCLEQPFYVPPLWYDTNSPKITTNEGASPYTAYAGGNNAFKTNFVADTNINVAFPRILVTSTNLTRNDGTTAKVGEPLVKKRFPLERLAWLTYKGPSAIRSLSDDDMRSLQSNGVTTALLTNGTADNIRTSFGLTWNNAGYWEYNPTNPPSGSIATLGFLATNNPPREPNFAELLKAAINVGSLGKSTGLASAGSYGDTNAAAYIHLRNTSVDYHVLRLMANIMDQADADGYPTTIKFVSTNPAQTYLINGTENLPYIYRTRHLLVRAKEGTYADSNGITRMVPTTPTGVVNTIKDATLISPGVGVMLLIPEIWNPHDQNSSMGTPCPTNCRIIAENMEGFPTDFGTGQLGLTNSNTIVISVGQRSPSSIPSRTYESLLPSDKRIIPTATNLTSSNSALLFTNAANLFRDPTSLHMTDFPVGSGLCIASNHMLQPGNFTNISTNSLFRDVVQADGSGVKESDTNRPCIGFYLGCVPLLQEFIMTNRTVTSSSGGTNTNDSIVSTNVGAGECGFVATSTNFVTNSGSVQTNINSGAYVQWDIATCDGMRAAGNYTLRLQYADPINISPTNWCDYDVKNWDLNDGNGQYDREIVSALLRESSTLGGYRRTGFMSIASGIDPRSGRFGLIYSRSGGTDPALYCPNLVQLTGFTSLNTWADTFGNTLGAQRFALNGFNDYSGYIRFAVGFSGLRRNADVKSGFVTPSISQLDLFAQNSSTNRNYYSDADGVIRGGMGNYAPDGTSSLGLPTISPNTNSGVLVSSPSAQSQSRPMILNRPFRSVAELGYVFSDLPWRNLDFFTPGSGNVALLDTFCIRDQAAANGLSAGKVSLNSRQAPVLQAVMSGGMIDELLRSGTSTRTLGSDTNVAIASSVAATNSSILAARTATNALYNVADLVGRWESGSGASASYGGFSRDINLGNDTNNVIQRFREAPIRALSNMGQTRVWNLMIDVVAQTGKFPPRSTDFNQFVVTGEKRLWLHVAIDRVTGRILDSSVEPVNE